MIGNFLGNFEKRCCYILGNFWEHLGYFLLQHLDTLAATDDTFARYCECPIHKKSVPMQNMFKKKSRLAGFTCLTIPRHET